MLITKSKYLLGLQCPKLLWVAFNDKSKIPKPDSATQHIFDEGHKVGELAKSLYPGGIDIPSDDFMGNIKKTKELSPKRKPLFEAGFKSGDIFARADILNPVGNDGWDIIEVKSSTQVKDVNLHDLSFQKYCYEKDGIKIRKCFLMHINNQYIKSGNINPEEFFHSEDVTGEVEELSKEVRERIEGMFKIIRRKECPDIDINKHCSDPYSCSLTNYCWSHLPCNCVFDLYRGGKKSFELYEKGIQAIKDIPNDFKLNDKQSIQKECEKTGKPYMHKEGIKHFLNTLHYPLYYLDFETFSTSIPLYDGTKPYQQIPFQFSLHIVKKKGAKPKHLYFLAEANGDPRKKFLEELKADLGNTGSIIVFNQSFEIGRLRELGEAFPEFKKWVESTTGRIVDLLIPFRNFHYYNSSQHGSASIKKVLPALTGKGYGGMDINNGGDASLAFLDLMFTEISKEDKKKVRQDLKKYCELDTFGMVLIIDELNKLI
jgi:hypothetical protein